MTPSPRPWGQQPDGPKLILIQQLTGKAQHSPHGVTVHRERSRTCISLIGRVTAEMFVNPWELPQEPKAQKTAPKNAESAVFLSE